MKLSPMFIIPEQKRSTTPDVFLTDQYGKKPDQHGDGELLINDAVRLSRIVTKMSPAFHRNNSIVYGFSIISVKMEKSDLVVKIEPGLGIINERVFKMHEQLEARWKNFANRLPTYFKKAKVLIYFVHSDIIQDVKNRPYEQNSTRLPTTVYPEEQSGFNPIVIRGSFYDPNSKQLIQEDDWDVNESKILITGAIWYEKDDVGGVDVTFDPDDKDSIDIIHPDGGGGGSDNDESLEQQGGGSNELKNVDGGPLDDSVDANKKPDGINEIVNDIVTDPDQKFPIPSIPSDFNNFYVFYNGVLYQKTVDWEIDSLNRLYFKNLSLTPGKMVYIFENISESPYGYIKNVYSNNLTANSTAITISGLNSKNKYLVFVNGLVVHSSDYTITTNKITFKFTIKQNYWVNINLISPATVDTPKLVDIVYDQNATSSSKVNVFGMTSQKCYLVFYNGVLYLEGYDYIIGPNYLLFAEVPMSTNKKLFILSV